MEVETSVKRRHDIYEMLEQQRAAAQKRRWRVSGTLLGTGVTLVILGLISKRLDASGVFGHGSYGNVGTVVITPAIGAVLLALLPTDTRTIRSLVDLSLVLMLTIGVMGMPTVFSAVINREHVSGYEPHFLHIQRRISPAGLPCCPGTCPPCCVSKEATLATSWR